MIIEPETQPIYVQRGKNFKMVCKSDGEMEWYKDGSKIDSRGDSNILPLNEEVVSVT